MGRPIVGERAFTLRESPSSGWVINVACCSVRAPTESRRVSPSRPRQKAKRRVCKVVVPPAVLQKGVLVLSGLCSETVRGHPFFFVNFNMQTALFQCKLLTKLMARCSILYMKTFVDLLLTHPEYSRLVKHLKALGYEIVTIASDAEAIARLSGTEPVLRHEFAREKRKILFGYFVTVPDKKIHNDVTLVNIISGSVVRQAEYNP